MTKTEYRQYIASEAWLQRRKRFLGPNPRCNRCDLSQAEAKKAYGQDLNVHHRDYQRLGRELDSDLEALCRRCHDIEHYLGSELWPQEEYVECRRRHEQFLIESASWYYDDDNNLIQSEADAR